MTDPPAVGSAEVRLALPKPGPGGRGPTPRLVRGRVRLEDGHEIGVAVAGIGVPLVIVHGFAAEGIVYAQTLSRLVGMGFKVVAIDTPSHGRTDPLQMFSRLDAYVDLLRRVLDHLELPEAVIVGHSMGGRLVAELVAREPKRALALVLVNAIAGERWDRIAQTLTAAPLGYLGLGAMLLADVIGTLPVIEDPIQSAKLARLIFPTSANHVRRPWRLIGPLQAIARAEPSAATLARLASLGVEVLVIHSDRDRAVPLRTGRDTARLTGADLVVVHDAGHSWLLGDPEAFPAIIAEQLAGGRLGRARAAALRRHGLEPDASSEAVEAAFYGADAPIRALTPPPGGGRVGGRPARLRWTVESAPGSVIASPGSA